MRSGRPWRLAADGLSWQHDQDPAAGGDALDIICASICFRGYAPDEVAATLELARGLGYRHMEVHGPRLWTVGAVDAFDLSRFQADLAASGLRCAGLYTPGWGGRDDAQVAEHARAIAKCVAFAEALGAHHVTCTGAESRGDGATLARVTECVRRVLAVTDTESPVKLTIEPHLGNALERESDFDAVLDAVSDRRLGVCVDTGHFHAAGVDTVGFIHRHADRIFAVHLKDHIGTMSVGIGRGEVDLAAIVAALRECGYSGGLTIELEVADTGNLPRYAQEAYIYVSGLLGQKL